MPVRFVEQISSLLKDNYKKSDENSQLISENCLRILSAYYFLNKEKEKVLHSFLRQLTFYKGFFNCIISSLNQIKYITDDNKISNKISDKNLRHSSSISEEPDFSSSSEPKETKKIDLLPLKQLNLSNLSFPQNHALIFLLQDCISMLFEVKEEESLMVDENINEIDSQEVYDTLMNNFREAFQHPGKNVYRDIFSSNKGITPKLFFFKWKKSNNENKIILIQTIKELHVHLLRTHIFPFIFKFLLYINADSNNKEESNMINDYSLELISFILNELENRLKEIEKNKNEYDNFSILNMINLLILIHNIVIFQKNTSYLENDKFIEIFLDIINIFEKTGLIYSKYCFEIEKKTGKIICEMIYDLFIYILDFKFEKKIENTFKEFFVKENKQKKVNLTVFYIIDLFKEEKLEKDKKTRHLIEGFLESKNLNYIHNNIFNGKIKGKVFGKSIKKIKGVNFSLYFLAKTFLYLKYLKKKDLSSFLYKNILSEISSNLYDLWTKKDSFYGHKICSKFLLYSETKAFFEQHVIQLGGALNLYEDFFDKDIQIKLKDQFKVNLCFASKLLDSKEDENNQNEEDDDEEENKAHKNLVYQDYNNKNINDNIFNFNCNKQFFLYENSEKKKILYNPKNILMKIIFSSTYKDIFFKDKIFEKIRSTYCCKYNRNKTFNITTKQLNFPVKQKNFSNSLEPKIFIRRDYNFYREEFFNVSHLYIKSNLIKENDKPNLFFYPHIYYDINENKDSVFNCELMTNQFIYFGKIFIGPHFISFESAPDPRDAKNVNLNIYYEYVFSQRDNDNKTTKEKCFIIFIKDIKEIMRRRTLLMNQSLEIFLKNGKSFFFNFFKIAHCDKVFKNLMNINDNLLLKNKKNIITKDLKASIKNTLSAFKKGEISNYEYLLKLNKYSSRTYNDLTQYPIFPWIILKINKLEELTKNHDIKLTKDKNKEQEINEKNKLFVRDMNYPVSMQNPEKRHEEINKFLEDSESKFCYHCGTHYSTSSYIFYYLMRINPFGQNLIKLQNYKQENPNRMFLSFRETQLILETSTDNRELIPDLYCYIDYFCNLNCSFNGIRNNYNLVDDFYIFDEYKVYAENENLISSFVEYLYRHKRLFNNIEITRNLDKWVDIIFGKKQLPQKKEEAAASCNIFSKLTYESKINLEDKLKKFKALKDKGELKESSLKSKLQNKINIINNFGVCPIQILTETNSYEENPNLNSQTKSNKEIKKKVSGEFYYFTRINDNHYLSIIENKNDTKKVNIYEDNLSKDKNIYCCGYFESDINNICMNSKYPLYKPNYSVAEIILIDESIQKKEKIILVCRYLGNYFKVQSMEKTLMILCEDFVTTIVSRNSTEGDKIFFTGLRNGLLTEWKIKIKKKDKINSKKKSKSNIEFSIKEKTHINDHKSSITAIEINKTKEIIATAGEDKFIHIRKLFDLEILTSIDLTYSFGNPLISKNQNIFPSLIKISDLNCIYVLLYNYKDYNTKIRGYTLNGLFFAETSKKSENLVFSSISFNKNWNLVVGCYNNNEMILLNAYNLDSCYQKKLIKEDKNMEQRGIKYLEYNSSSKEFIILLENECQIIKLVEEEQKLIDT